MQHCHNYIKFPLSHDVQRTVEYINAVKMSSSLESGSVHIYLGKKNLIMWSMHNKNTLYLCLDGVFKVNELWLSPICRFSGSWKFPVSYLWENVVVHDARTEEDVILVSGMCLLVVVSNLKHSHDFLRSP